MFIYFFQFLFIISTIGTASGLIVLAVYMMFKSWSYDLDFLNWIPVASFSSVIFIASWAILTLPYLVTSELMPEKLKDAGQTFCLALVWILSFLTVKMLPVLTDSLGFHGTMFFFAGWCIVSLVFIIFCMPETKGKSHEQIMMALERN